MNDPPPEEVFTRFSRRLIALVRDRLDARTRRRVDPEDVVQSVFRSFFTRRAAGKLQADDWDELWRILVVITVRKCRRKRTAARATRRDVRRDTALPGATGEAPTVGDIADREPRPEEVAALMEAVERLLAGGDDIEREIIAMRLQGFNHREISETIPRISERKVYRVLAQARKRLAAWQE